MTTEKNAWRNVTQDWPENPCSITAPQRISTLMPLYCRSEAAFFGIAREAFAVCVPHGWTQGKRPASSSVMILSVIS
jgi:hypothetical protein